MANYDYAVLITGNGDTTRANVEALFEDYILSKNGKGVLVLAFESKPSAAQIWAGQMATQHGMEAIIVSPPNGLLDAVPKGSFVQAPVGEAMAIGVSVLRSQSDDLAAFIVWSDEDNDSAQTLAECVKYKVFAFDLTNGLCSIIGTETSEDLSKLVPVMPAAEMVEYARTEALPLTNATEPVSEFGTETAGEASADEDEEEGDELVDAFYTILYSFAELVADTVIEKMKADK